MAVKTEIMTKNASDATYDATDETKGNPGALLTIVKNELKGDEWRNPDPIYDQPSKTIKITYTDTSLREGMEGEGKPAQNGKIYFEIELDKQDVALSIDGESSNGGASRSKQANLGIQNLKWYVLSADSNGVNLVSDPTSKAIQFSNAGGYDNCLYYLNEIATKLCTNEIYGVTVSKVHALRLTDIKNATEKMNGSSYNWDIDMIKSSNTAAYNDGAVGTKVITPSNKRYPQIYGTETGDVSTGNPMYDEEIPSNFIPISGDLINGDTPTSATASTLRVNYTYFITGNNENTIAKLGTFGTSGIGTKLFDSSGIHYWLASRCVLAYYSPRAYFYLRYVSSGSLNHYGLADSGGDTRSISNAYRFIVSIPLTKVNITEEGAVTLK